MIKVYIASPYTLGDVNLNVKRQMEIANTLIDNGFAPFVPLYYHFQNETYPRPYEDWVKLGIVWLKNCDCLLRLQGISKGADIEVEVAKKLNLPIFYFIEILIDYYEYIK